MGASAAPPVTPPGGRDEYSEKAAPYRLDLLGDAQVQALIRSRTGRTLEDVACAAPRDQYAARRQPLHLEHRELRVEEGHVYGEAHPHRMHRARVRDQEALSGWEPRPAQQPAHALSGPFGHLHLDPKSIAADQRDAAHGRTITAGSDTTLVAGSAPGGGGLRPPPPPFPPPGGRNGGPTI